MAIAGRRWGLVVAYLLPAFAEEVGGSAYLTTRLEPWLGTGRAGLLIGVLWAAWHVVPYAQVGHPAAWIVWQCAATVAARVLIIAAWRGSGRCVPVAAVMHASINVAAAVVPGGGAGYDPAEVAPAFVLAAAAVFAAGRGRPRYVGSGGGTAPR